MADPSEIDAPDEPLDGRPLAYDVFELQSDLLREPTNIRIYTIS